MAKTLEENRRGARDFVVRANAVELDEEARMVGLPLDEPAPIRPFAHAQLSDFTKIPKRYYDRMLVDDPSLLATNVNRWLFEKDDARMIRTLHGEARAVVSQKFRPLDNFELGTIVLEELMGLGAEVVSTELTETRFYLKAVNPNLELPVLGSQRVGDVVRAGICVSNSEVGNGSLKIEEWELLLACLNGQASHSTFKRHHVGDKHELDAEVRELLSDGTKEKRDEAFWMTVRDVVKAAFDESRFRARVDRMSATTKHEIESNDFPAVVEMTRDTLGLSNDLQDGILGHLVRGGDLTQWGLINAVTRTAEDVESYDLAMELERAGGKLIELEPRAWEKIAQAEVVTA